MIQYSLVFPVFGIFLNFSQVWGGMSVVFLAMAVIPTFTFLTELGLRWGASIQVLELFNDNTIGIFAASFTDLADQPGHTGIDRKFVNRTHQIIQK